MARMVPGPTRRRHRHHGHLSKTASCCAPVSIQASHIRLRGVWLNHLITDITIAPTQRGAISPNAQRSALERHSRVHMRSPVHIESVMALIVIILRALKWRAAERKTLSVGPFLFSRLRHRRCPCQTRRSLIRRLVLLMVTPPVGARLVRMFSATRRAMTSSTRLSVGR